jgi:hypothetical protein
MASKPVISYNWEGSFKRAVTTHNKHDYYSRHNSTSSSVYRTQSQSAVSRQVRVHSRVILWDLWRTMWHWDGFVSQYYEFLLSVSLQQCSVLIHPSTTNAKLTCQVRAFFNMTPKNFRYVLVTGCVFVSWGEKFTVLAVLLRLLETATAMIWKVSINHWRVSISHWKD